MKTTKRFLMVLAVLVIGAPFLLMSACGGDDDALGETNTETRTATLGDDMKNIQLLANQQTEISFTYVVPGAITSKGGYTVNLTETLKNVSLSSAPIAKNTNRLETLRMLAAVLIRDAFAQEETQVTVFVSYPDDPDVCSSPNVFGPYTILGAIGTAVTSNTETAAPTDAVVNISNLGSVEVCVVTTPPINAYLTVTGVVVDLEDCAAPTVSIADTDWSGTYTCDNFGTGDEGGDVDLTITRNQDGSYHYFDDGGAEYDGHLCGNRFRFSGGLSGSYTESGTLVFSSNTAATKTSTWNGIPPGFSGGNCSDTLEKL
ncbi:MAG: hypothetical protein AB7Q01_11560 [Gammaproteobacteria bacterium]